MKFQLFPDGSGEWRWRLIAANGKIMADSGEGYVNRSDARNAVARIKRLNQKTKVEVLDADPRAPAPATTTTQGSVSVANNLTGGVDARNPSPSGAVRG